MRVEVSSDRISGNLAKKVIEISKEDILLCYQCGMCSAGCPITFAMDLLPNQIIRLVQLGLEEDIAKSNSGFVLDVRNTGEMARAVITLLGDEQLRKEMGRRARKIAVEKYSWSKIAEQVAEVCRSAIEEKRGM